MSQLYLIKISGMYKGDGLDIVPSAEFICDRDLSTNGLPLFDALFKLQNDFATMVSDMPGTSARAMTRDEVEAWRDEQHKQEEQDFEVVEV